MHTLVHASWLNQIEIYFSILARKALTQCHFDSLRQLADWLMSRPRTLINAQARSDLQDSSDQSREAALHDPLTGLPNRVLMLERLEHAVLRSRRSGHTAAVFFLDLDEFKAVNGTYGHRAGDELLVALAAHLTGVLRPGGQSGPPHARRVRRPM